MVASVSFNPIVTTNAAGSFNTQSNGFIQGQAQDDPSARNRLQSGILAQSETIVMWGGVGIYNDVPGPGPTVGSPLPQPELGGNLGRATSLTNAASKQLTGFSVFDQAHSMIQSPQSPVPLAGSGMSVNYYLLGSLARIAVACDPALVDLEGNIITTQVSWDFVNQLLVPFEASALTISSGTYNNTTGEVTLTMSASINFGPGDAIIVSSLTGTGAYASLNGTFTADTGTAGTTVKYNAGASLGAATITGGSLTLGSGANSALPVKIMGVNIGNSMTVEFDTDTGFATWNPNGSCALIKI